MIYLDIRLLRPAVFGIQVPYQSVLLLKDSVHLRIMKIDFIVFKLHRHIGIMHVVIHEIFLNKESLISEADDEFVESIMTIGFHDMPKGIGLPPISTMEAWVEFLFLLLFWCSFKPPAKITTFILVLFSKRMSTEILV